MNRRVRELTMAEFAARAGASPWLILPVGTTEEHGPHLPLGADIIQAEYLAERVAEAVDGLVAPGLAYGLCRTTRNFPGTISISYGTLEALATEILQGYAGQGFRKILVLSGHAGGAHMMALRQAALRLAEADERLTILVLCTYDVPPPFLAAEGLMGDGHAGSLETSTMWAIAADLVHLDAVPEATRPRFPPFQVLAHPERYFPSGVMGDTSKASRELGERAVAAMVDRIAALLREAGGRAGPAGPVPADGPARAGR